MPTVCLSMIVKNEERVIERCLASVKDYIDYWVVVDTGSTDDTRACVWRALAGVQGELVQTEWIDFAYNRNQALERARGSGCEYILIVDADEWMEVDDPAWRDRLVSDAYAIVEHYPESSFPALRLVRNLPDWAWRGVIHEALYADPDPGFTLFDGFCLRTDNDSARNRDPLEHEKDLAILAAALQEEPDNPRYQFYEGVTLQAMGRWDDSIIAFGKRVALGGGNTLEMFYSIYAMGLASLRLGHGPRGVERLQVAYGMDPRRAEPLYWIGMQFHINMLYAGALPFFELAASKEVPVGMFVDPSIYEGRAQLMLAVCCASLGHHADARALAADIENLEDLPEAERDLLATALDSSLR